MKTSAFKLVHLCLIATSIFLLSGCSSLMRDRAHQDEKPEQYSRIDKHSAFPAVRRSNFEQVNLVELIDPSGNSERQYKNAWKEAEKIGGDREWGLKYDLVLAYFREVKTPQNLEAARQHRNSVQDRIMGVSTSRCNVFKTYLRRQQADTNFWLGSLTTAAGVLGGVLPGANASRNLAGTAGLLSGVNAEFNSEYYSNLAAHVIVQGIEIHQNRLQKELLSKRQSLPVAEYSMEAAIKDAIAFDGTCSTVVGLTEAAESIRQNNDPSFATAARFIAASKALRTIEQTTDFNTLTKSGELEQLLKQTDVKASPLVVSSLKMRNEADLQDRLLSAQSFDARARLMIDQASRQAGQRFEAARSQWGTATSTVTVSDISAHFQASLLQAYTSTLQANASACVSQLLTPTQELGSALFAANSDEASIDKQQALGIARVKANAAIDRVSRYEAELKRVIEKTLKDWTELFVKPPKDKTAFITTKLLVEDLPTCKN
jgi:hypothetical protein